MDSVSLSLRLGSGWVHSGHLPRRHIVVPDLLARSRSRTVDVSLKRRCRVRLAVGEMRWRVSLDVSRGGKRWVVRRCIDRLRSTVDLRLVRRER